jgi:sensor domain CHASE-containing protein
MVIGLTAYFALSLLAALIALIVFTALILGSRADRLDDAAVQQLYERQQSAA